MASAWSKMSIAVQACLLTLGSTMLGLSKETERQMDMCLEYDKRIMMMHVNIMDFIWKNYADNPDVAKQLAGWKDHHINPITDRMNYLLEATRNKVIHGKFDAAEFQSAENELEKERAKAAQFISARNPV
jgi:hypothetical protein